jgi:broad specificity phosphatase PhoE
MQFYFVRHAETVGNTLGVQQFDNIQLSELGKAQAYAVGKYLKTKDIDLLLTSPLYRAKETADVIAKLINKEHQTVQGLEELKHPSSMQGKRYDDKEVLYMKEQLFNKADDVTFRIDDGENFIEFGNRCKETLAYLTTRQEQVIAVVTHGYVIRMYVLLAMFNSFLKPNFIEVMRHFWLVSTASVTKLDYINGAWYLRGFNDTAQLNQLPKGHEHY